MNYLDVGDKTIVSVGPVGVYRRNKYEEWLWMVRDDEYIYATGTVPNEDSARWHIWNELEKLSKCDSVEEV